MRGLRPDVAMICIALVAAIGLWSGLCLILGCDASMPEEPAVIETVTKDAAALAAR